MFLLQKGNKQHNNTQTHTHIHTQKENTKKNNNITQNKTIYPDGSDVSESSFCLRRAPWCSSRLCSCRPRWGIPCTRCWPRALRTDGFRWGFRGLGGVGFFLRGFRAAVFGFCGFRVVLWKPTSRDTGGTSWTRLRILPFDAP